MDRSKVLDIAFDSGFGDVSNFNRAFRAEFGVSPRAYRSAKGCSEAIDDQQSAINNNDWPVSLHRFRKHHRVGRGGAAGAWKEQNKYSHELVGRGRAEPRVTVSEREVFAERQDHLRAVVVGEQGNLCVRHIGQPDL